MFSVRTARFEALPTRNDGQDMRLSTSVSVAHVGEALSKSDTDGTREEFGCFLSQVASKSAIGRRIAACARIGTLRRPP